MSHVELEYNTPRVHFYLIFLMNNTISTPNTVPLLASRRGICSELAAWLRKSPEATN